MLLQAFSWKLGTPWRLQEGWFKTGIKEVDFEG